MRYTLYQQGEFFFFAHNSSALRYSADKNLKTAYVNILLGTLGVGIPLDHPKKITELNALDELQETYPEYFI